MDAFSAMKMILKEDDIYNKTKSSKGAVCLESSLNNVLDLYSESRPGVEPRKIIEYLDKIIASGNVNHIVDAFVIMFQKRDIAEEARRDEPYIIFLHLYSNFKRESIECLEFFIKFGYWYDLVNIWRIVCQQEPKNQKLRPKYYHHWNPLIMKIIQLFIDQREKDYIELQNSIFQNRNPVLSLCSKWIPSENSRDNDLYDKRSNSRSKKRREKALNAKRIELLKKRAEYHSEKDEQKLQELKDEITKLELQEMKLEKNKVKTNKKHRKDAVWWYIVSKDGILHREPIVNMFIRYLLREGTEEISNKEIHFSEKKRFRKTNQRLRSALNLVESNLCQDTRSKIIPKKIPGKARKKYIKTLLNEKCSHKEQIMLEEFELETGNRSDHPEWIDLRKRMRTFFGQTGIDGINVKTLNPVDIYCSIKDETSEAAKMIYEKEWSALVSETLQEVEQIIAENPKRKRRIIPMCDLSGSMYCKLPGYGKNKEVIDAAISLSILCAQARPKYDPLRLTMVGFSNEPTVFNISEDATLMDKVNEIVKNTHGDYLTTNYKAAIMSLLRKIDSLVRAGRMKAEEITEVVLVAFSDMQWDDTFNPGYDNDWNNTTYEHLIQEAMRLGLPGLPTFAFWNLNTYPKSIQGESDCRGMEFYQGYSKGNIKYLFCGSDETAITQEYNVDGFKRTMFVASVTPLEKMNKIINNKKFDIVRNVFYNSTSGLFASYIR